MKYFGVYVKEGRIHNVRFLGNVEDSFVNGVKISGASRAMAGARDLFDSFEHDNFYVATLDNLVYMDVQIRQAINDSNFPTS